MTRTADSASPDDAQNLEPALVMRLGAYRGDLVRLATWLLKGQLAARVDPSDIVQQTLLEAHSSMPSFRGTERQLWPWLSQILQRNVSNQLRDHGRAQRRAVGRERALGPADDLDSPVLGASGQSTPSQRAIRAEDEQRLQAALSRLPTDQATALRMRHFEQKSLCEIAEALGRSTSAAAGLVKRGMYRLKELLAEDGDVKNG